MVAGNRVKQQTSPLPLFQVALKHPETAAQKIAKAQSSQPVRGETPGLGGTIPRVPLPGVPFHSPFYRWTGETADPLKPLRERLQAELKRRLGAVRRPRRR